MNDINFLNPISQKRQLQFYLWLKISAFLIGLIVCVISFFYIKQIKIIKSLQSEKELFEQKLRNFDLFVSEKEKIKTYLSDVKNRLSTINIKTKKTNKDLPSSILDLITKITPDNLYLEKIDYNSKKGLVIKGYSYLAEDIINFIQNLNNIPSVYNVKLEYLKIKENLLDSDVELPTLHEFATTLKFKKIINKNSSRFKKK